MADNLQNLFDFLDKSGMVDRFGQFDVTEVARALAHCLGAGLATELSIDRSEKRVIEATVTRLCFVLLHRFGISNVADTHVLDLLGRHQPELNLFHRLERSARVSEVKVSHGGDM